ncbi:MAG: D-2-hydroxyacid dehydrogenase [Erysipelotrichaceae bacterium]|nr:D-2-hydroxyacid dehydrogenase [Erysipelotrichaceae bacterium]
MKKVFVPVKLNDVQKQKIESVSDQYEFTYEVDKDANIILGNYNPSELKEFKNLEWIQTTAVGVDAFIKKGILNDNVVLTNAVDIHSQEVAEHAFGLMVTLLKKLYLYRDNQTNHEWHDESKVKSYVGLRVCIVGLGDIGKCLAKICHNMGMHVIGVKRKMIDKPDYVDELYTNADTEKAISDVDVVFTILPGSKENTHLFTVDTFRKMRKDTILVNVGRGNLYSEETLIEVLENHIIEAIGMDVFEIEPIPKDSKLWTYKNLLITPHVAGYFHLASALDAYVDLLAENLKRFINNEELKYIVKEREQ